MKKEEFLAALRERLEVFPKDEAEGYLNYYREMIEDHVDDGFPEEKVIETLGSVDDIFAVILQETAITKLLKEKMKPKRKLKKWEILLLSVGAPVWVPLAIALAATALSLILTLYIVLWALTVSLCVVELSLAVGGLGAVFASLPQLVAGGNTLAAGVLFSAALVCIGLSLALFHPIILAIKGTVALTKQIWLGIKSLIVRKEKKHE